MDYSDRFLISCMQLFWMDIVYLLMWPNMRENHNSVGG